MQSIENQIRERVARFLEVTGVRLPLMNAPMAEVSGPALTAAMCRAGGLGVLAGDELLPEALSNAIDEVRRLAGADARFAVNLRVPPAKAPTPEGIDCQRRMLAALEDLAADLGLEPNTIEELPDFDEQGIRRATQRGRHCLDGNSDDASGSQGASRCGSRFGGCPGN